MSNAHVGLSKPVGGCCRAFLAALPDMLCPQPSADSAQCPTKMVAEALHLMFTQQGFSAAEEQLDPVPVMAYRQIPKGG